MSNETNVMSYTVLVNEEEQYSLWPKGQPIPRGWRAVGKEGTADECCSYVDEVWTDMRPLSLRREMQTVSSDGSGTD